MTFVSYLSFLTFGIGILFSIFLLARFKQFRSTLFLLSIIFCVCGVEFYMYALSSKEILHLTFLYRTAFPFRTLLPVFLWLYTWSMLHPSKPIEAKQYFHFLIPLLVTISLVPDFLKPSQYKIATFMQFYSQNNLLLSRPAGLLPAGFIQPFTIIFSLFYCMYTLIYIRKFLRKKDTGFIESNRAILRWIKIVSITLSIFIVFQGTQYITLLIGGYFNYISQICQSMSLLYMKGYLLVSPLVIENMDGCIEKTDLYTHIESVKLLPDIQGDFITDRTAESIINYLSKEKRYLEEDISITKMASDLNISKHKLSKLIQRGYQTGFTELINRYRLHHFIDLSKENSNLKMDVLIKQSGFAQRSTFYLVFKKYTGSNPSVYLKGLSKKA